MTVRTVLDCKCDLGEGPLWTGGRLYFFDIRDHRLHAVDADGGGHQSWEMGEYVSAAAQLDDGGLLVASERALFRFDPATGARREIAALEADNPATRSNDGRADRRGGFWIGTMGKEGGTGAGAIYRYRQGELRLLYEAVTIPNATCFSPDGGTAYFTDTVTQTIRRQALDAEGWPEGPPEPLIDFHDDPGAPDGAAVDSEGYLWCALYNGSAVVRISPEGAITERVELPVPAPTCPAFGGPELKTVFVTTARQKMSDEALAAAPLSGAILAFDIEVAGLADPVISL